MSTISAAPPAEPVTTLENANGTTETTSSTPTLPKTKISAIARFKSFTNSNFKSSNNVQFPPTSWSLTKSPDAGSGSSSWSNDMEKWKVELERWKQQMKSGFPALKRSRSETATPVTSEEPAEASTSVEDKGKKEDTKDDTNGAEAPEQTTEADPKDPRTLAMRIKALIDENLNLTSTSKPPAQRGSQSAPPTPGPSTSSEGIGTSSGAVTPKAENIGNGSMFNFGIDSKLAKLLSSETIMNGGLEKGRESVWAILDKMGYGGKGKGKEKDNSAVEEEGIMMYTPLQPTNELEPEIAESVLEYPDDTETDAKGNGHSTNNSGTDVKPPAEESKPKAKPKRVFQPSPTKLSLQCTWWGYRLYIPPPIMAQLSNAHIEAAKRGAMITAALKWLLDKVPIMMVPAQMRPGMLLLRKFSPYLGYVGAFVAWSWGRVESQDTGNGVVLTATWLLPIAILPASWDFEVHGRPVEEQKERIADAKNDTISKVQSASEAGPSTNTDVAPTATLSSKDSKLKKKDKN
ncbi:hypothetical protein Moror_17809 [Moniliophthora roreri MCA 2997]|uniref:Uncharacterized protein n=1 Tax=Moniliophthora roreri (strain MCA 2997) TaxID=1381753 RepID=V2XDV8_MONRO|nr:hypothetical protein Moror_17809 [Moniliophthora roreri MCA 2997]